MANTYKLASFLIVLGLFIASCGPTEKPAKVDKAAETERKIVELIKPKILNKAIPIGECVITHYCICEKCCGKTPDHPAYGITKSGRKAWPWISVAVDESVIPLGSEVIIDYGGGNIKHYMADDTGSAIKGNRIDVCVNDHQTALGLGIKTGKVYYKSNLK